jgi:hypothetical protein
MRQIFLYIIAAMFTFIIGVGISFLGKYPATDIIAPIAISPAITSPPIKAGKVCEIHHSLLHKELIYKGWDNDSLESNLYESHLVESAEDWEFWVKYYRALRTEFPHAYFASREDYIPCKLNGKRCGEIEVCDECRQAEIRWVRKAIQEHY